MTLPVSTALVWHAADGLALHRPMLGSDSSSKPGDEPLEGFAKKPYQKPELINHGSVGELTQSGGRRHRDGVATRKLS